MKLYSWSTWGDSSVLKVLGDAMADSNLQEEGQG